MINRKGRPELGARFGRLVVTGFESRYPYVYAICRCDCGTIRSVRNSCLRSGETKSCGCLSREKSSARVTTHGLSKHPLYDRWVGMHNRCYKTFRKDYKHYGGRGIKVCDRWHGEQGLLNFIQDMSPTYKEGLEIDRTDVDGDYCPENCSWQTRRKQVINRRPTGVSFDTHYITYQGKTQCLSEWADEMGLKPSILSDRITKLKWPLDKAMSKKPRAKNVRVTVCEKEFTTKEIFVNPINLYYHSGKLGLDCVQYLKLLLGEMANVEVYVCKEWVTIEQPRLEVDGKVHNHKTTEYFNKFLEENKLCIDEGRIVEVKYED